MPDTHDPSGGDTAPLGCLSLEALEDALTGKLTPDRDAPTLEHLRECMRCRSRLEDLRAANEFLGRIRPAPGPDEERSGGSRPAEGPGTVIGRYKLLQQIGEGGFGVVFLAEQREPVKRRVALKIIKLGMDTRHVIARFEAERQALAMMDHPNIAKVLDAGATDAGRPYFVMELVRGISVLEYCDGRKLDTPGRLEIFMSICHAIQHAHQKGVIHRDIKPSNVLITLHDGVPVPKVIDFGIAKATNQELTEKTLFTAHRQMIGTPTYMSPEQAEMSGLDIDTRCDIYSLGVLLYELLTGTTPFDSESLVNAGFLEMLRIIREQEPPRPSTRLSSLGESASRTAESRHAADPRKLSLLLRGDLDWIVMKCLEKDRTRRYATATELAADIRRHLRHEPVEAGPPRAAYRIRKFVRRHRAAVAGAGAGAGLLVLAVTATSAAMFSAIRANERLDQRAEELDRVVQFQASQLSSIDAPRMAGGIRDAVITETRAALALTGATGDAIDEQIALLEDTIAPASFTNVALGVLRSDVFAGALAAIETTFADQPLLQARLEHIFAIPLSRLELTDMAVAPLRHSLETRSALLGDEHPDTLASLSSTAALLLAQHKPAEAEPLARKLLEVRRRVLSADDPDTLAALGDLGRTLAAQGKYDEAEECLQQALEGCRRVFGPEDQSTLGAMADLGDALQRQGRMSEALPYIQQALDARRLVLGSDHRDTLDSLNSLGELYVQLRQGAQAEACYREALETARRTLGENHSRTLRAVNGLAAACWAQGKFPEAATQLREVLAVSVRTRGALAIDEPDTLTVMHNLGMILQESGSFEESERYLTPALEGRRRVLGDRDEATLSSMLRVGVQRLAQGRLEEAEALCREAVEGCRVALQPTHRGMLTAFSNMTKVLRARGKAVEAEQFAREAVAWCADNRAPENPDTLQATVALAEVLNDLSRFSDSLELLHDVEPLAREAWKAPNAAPLGDCLAALGVAQWRSGDPVAAEATLADAYQRLAGAYGERDRRTIRCLEQLVALYSDPPAGQDDPARESKATAWGAKLDAARGQ